MLKGLFHEFVDVISVIRHYPYIRPSPEMSHVDKNYL
jgi:hypothetical protein